MEPQPITAETAWRLSFCIRDGSIINFVVNVPGRFSRQTWDDFADGKIEQLRFNEHARIDYFSDSQPPSFVFSMGPTGVGNDAVLSVRVAQAAVAPALHEAVAEAAGLGLWFAATPA